mmetsp:Transcript_34212/g.41919  ORF Transcript_34212/g.41919 Transcript_34212/m.41919 type:complete len:212 (+) Transcript_34212:178-813(+)
MSSLHGISAHLLLAFTLIALTESFAPTAPLTTFIQSHHRTIHNSPSHGNAPQPLRSSDWSDFAILDDDDDFDVDLTPYADENDPQERKAEIGMSVPAPTVSSNYDPIYVGLGETLPLSEENVEGVLAACREEIGTLFGYTAENRGVGITGAVDFVEMDGPIVILTLKGRYWHQRTTVLERVKSYILERIPEVIDVAVADEWELTDEANEVF